MQLLSFFSGLFFVSVFINLLPYDWSEHVSPMAGGISYFVAFVGFIVSVAFLAPILFEEKLTRVKKYVYIALGAYTVCLAVDVLLRQEVYETIDSTWIHYIILCTTSAIVLFCLARIKLYTKEQNVDLSYVNGQFLKRGAVLEDTPLFKAVTVLDRYFIGFVVMSIMIESEFILIGITILLLILATKNVRVVYKEFKVSLIGKRKSLLSVALFYLSYALAVMVSITLDKDVLTIFVASLSVFFIKIYYHEIVKETLRSAG